MDSEVALSWILETPVKRQLGDPVLVVLHSGGCEVGPAYSLLLFGRGDCDHEGGFQW